jgi:hypothetical protein
MLKNKEETEWVSCVMRSEKGWPETSDLSTSSKQIVERTGPGELFGPPPLIEGEDAAAYNQLHARISGAVKPKDVLEEIWVRDVVDLAWEILRMRRFKAKLLASATSTGLQRILKRATTWMLEAQGLSQRWAARDPQAIKQVDKQLAIMGLTMEAVTAETFFVMINDIERIDRMIMNAEARRNAALREVDRHRSSVAQALRRASEEVVEAEFEDVAPDQIGRRDVA